MEVGRDDFRKVVGILERIAVANEELIVLAKQEREPIVEEAQPVSCPHCGATDPRIRNEGGSGEISRFTLVADCGNCGKRFFGFSHGWTVVPTVEMARALEEAGRAGS